MPRGMWARVLLRAARTSSVEFRGPLVGLHVYPPVQKELHSLALQESALRTGVANPEVRAAGSALLDDPVAGDTGPVGIVVHRPPHGAGRAWRPKHSCDLAVRGHLSPGNADHQGVHPVEKTSRPFLRPDSPRAPRPAGRSSHHAHGLPSRQDLPDSRCDLLAFGILGDKVDLLWPSGAEADLDGARDLLLVEDPSARDRRIPPVHPQDGHTNRIHRHPVRAQDRHLWAKSPFCSITL